MKVSLLLLVCAALFSLRSYSQTDTTERMNRNRYGTRGDTATFQESDSMYGMYGNQTRQSRDSMHYNGYMMENGRMMVMKNGVSTVLNTDTTLSNGTKIMRNGEIIVNGARRTLHEGEYVNMAGKIMPMNRGDRDMDKMNRDNRDRRDRNDIKRNDNDRDRNMNQNNDRNNSRDSLDRDRSRDRNNMNRTNDENRNEMRDSLNKNNQQRNRDIERERNRVKTPSDSANRKSDMYLVPDSAKKNYEKK